MTEELKPCPLCGGHAEFEYTPWNDEHRTGDDGTGCIECQKCHLELAGYDRDEAENRWNRLGERGGEKFTDIGGCADLGKCLWTNDPDDDSWDTECGEKFVFNEGTPIENDFHFCPYCGNHLFDA